MRPFRGRTPPAPARTTRGRSWFLLTLGLAGLAPAAVAAAVTVAALAPDSRSLAGRWRVRLDRADAGLTEAWFARPLEPAQTLRLPGTTDLAGLGDPLDPVTLRYAAEFPYTRFPGVKEADRADERGFLVRQRLFLGPAWYERDIEIPDTWRDHQVILRLERVLWQTDAWVDGRPAGTADSLATPHEHRLGDLAPGRHRLTLRIDNRMILNVSTITHAYGPETQSRWNGVVGRIELVAAPPVAIRRLDVFPSPDRRSARVVAQLEATDRPVAEALLRLHLQPGAGGDVLATRELRVRCEPGSTTAAAVLELGAPAEPWDEFHPARYRVTAELRPVDGPPHRAEAWFGFRHFERVGRALQVNGGRVFLRGTLDCAVYPATGHPPMTVPEWEGVFRTVKAHGFNHVRFHTWCPPEAAFEAADRLGVYLMPETATWIDDWTRATAGRPPAVGRDPAVNRFVQDEIRRISEAYGNHPSFALFGIGNEFGLQGTDWEQVEAWVEEAKVRDPRRLYSGATARRHLPPDDVWITHAVHGKAARGVGPPRTDWDFREACHATDAPVIAHETGQRPVFPDYDRLLPKFGGPLEPLNYRRLRDALLASGMAGQARDFLRASARFQLVQYKAEHEALRRTAECAGYQLLMLNDFTGQSEALVGILDPFWESKGVVRPGEVRSWNAPTVPLARFASYTWSAADTFLAELEVAHHGAKDLTDAGVRWELRLDRGRRLAQGRLGPRRIPRGGITALGTIQAPLGGLTEAAALRLRVRVGDAENAWWLWVYPPQVEPPPPGLQIVRQWDATAEEALAKGGTVLFLAHGFQGTLTARTPFESVYWSAGWWGNAFSSLGILCDPGHPALAGFPNAGHSDWQWQTLTAGATTFLLEGVPGGFRPIVQAVPDFHFNRRLAQVWEARVGGGRLLACGYDLDSDLDRRHAARQMRTSLFRYAASPRFQPRDELPLEFVRRLFGS